MLKWYVESKVEALGNSKSSSKWDLTVKSLIISLNWSHKLRKISPKINKKELRVRFKKKDWSDKLVEI